MVEIDENEKIEVKPKRRVRFNPIQCGDQDDPESAVKKKKF